MKELIVQKFHDTIWSGHLKFEKTKKIGYSSIADICIQISKSMSNLAVCAWSVVLTNTLNGHRCKER